jgi:geranylgeranyl diphosphate synthase, type II
MSRDGCVILQDGDNEGPKPNLQKQPHALTLDDPHVFLHNLRTVVEDRLQNLLVPEAFVPANLSAAMAHALMGGGKRFRPLFFLCLVSTDSKQHLAVDIGCAVEMIHSASLILDDLPCMDDAEVRRRLPSTHKAFGQATAILAAISLLTRGIDIISRLDDIPADQRVALVSVLTRSAGHEGLAGGQELDLNGGTSLDGLAGVEQKNGLKTGALFVAMAEMAALLDSRSHDERRAIRDFASCVGSAFQAMDDYLDLTAQADFLGKDTLKDIGKNTIAANLGEKRAWLAYTEHLRAAYALLPACRIREDAARIMLQSVFIAEPVGSSQCSN